MKLTAVVAVLGALCGSAIASTLNFGTGGGRGHMFVVEGSNTRTPAGSLVRLGYFDGDVGDLSNFREYGTTTISHPGPSVQVGGFLTAPVSNNDQAANTAARGKQIYIWVYNSDKPETATAQGLFTSSDSSWVIPEGFSGAGSESNNLNPIRLALTENVTAISIPGFGTASFSVGPIDLAGTTVNGAVYTLGQVPEPSVAALLIPALGLLMRRRR